MTTIALTFPAIFLVAGTRVILGMGMTYFFARWPADSQFERAAVALTLTGAPATIPLPIEALDENEIL
jgi:hypothetical protein